MNILEITSTDVKFDEIDKAGKDFERISSVNIDGMILDDNKQCGFVGKAFIYDEEIFINTYSGKGFDIVFSKMKNYIDWYSGKIRLAGFEREDIKQLIAMILLDGIRRYNPALKIKLSTFLYVHIKNRIISRIKEETRQSLNATYNNPSYKFICKCGTSFIKKKTNDSDNICISCNAVVDNTWTIRAEHCEPISLDSITSLISDEQDSGMRQQSIMNNTGAQNHFIDFFGRVNTIEDVEKNIDISNILHYEDAKTCKIAKLMYYNDYSITDAAKEVGLTCWAASLRLKKLQNKKSIKEHFLNR